METIKAKAKPASPACAVGCPDREEREGRHSQPTLLRPSDSYQASSSLATFFKVHTWNILRIFSENRLSTSWNKHVSRSQRLGKWKQTKEKLAGRTVMSEASIHQGISGPSDESQPGTLGKPAVTKLWPAWLKDELPGYGDT